MSQKNQSETQWTPVERAIFRFFALYFFIQILPLDARFFKNLFSINWLDIQYRDIFYLSRFAPSFVGEESFINWVIVFVIALVGSVVWRFYTKPSTDYDKLYYWIRVLVRYRLAIGVIAYGFIKFFPLQAPLPSISNLNTNYGDFTAWKLFSLGLGVVPNYQSFLGLIEILGGLLLLHRKTATIGTLIILPFTGNVFVSNVAYEGGEYIYSLYLISLALYLFAFDAIRLFNLLSLEKPTQANQYKPVFTGRLKQTRLVLKTIFILFFVVLYGFKTYAGYKKEAYQFPATKGLENLEGVYNVSTFKLNSHEIPYSKTDSTRWQDVVFEKWNTISVKSNRVVKLDLTNTEEIHENDTDRNYEFAGSQGRHYYSYELGADKKTLALKNRNSNYPNDWLQLSLAQPNDSTVVLSGINNKKDSIEVTLNRINKKYLVFEAQKTGRQRGLKL